MNSNVLGQVIGQVLGEVMGELEGDDMAGMSTVGRHHRHRGHALALPAMPSWRKTNAGLPAGVNAPSEGLEPLPLTPSANNGVFTNAVTNINFGARPQRPFRSERLLASVIKTGTTAAAVNAVTNGVFVGTALQQLQIGNYNLEFFAPTAFGVRLDMQPAEAGIDITVQTILTGALTSPDTVAVQLLLLGRSLR